MKLVHPNSDQEIDVRPDAAERYLSQGWREPTKDAPKGNASLEDWQDFARSQGMADEDLEGLSRDDLRAALA